MSNRMNNDNERDDNPRGSGSWKTAIAITLVLLALFAVFGLPILDDGAANGTVEEINFSQVAAHARNGEIERITVDGERLEIVLRGGREVVSYREPGAALTDSLRNYGVTPEQLAPIQLRVEEQPANGGWGLSMFWLLPIFFIGFMFMMMLLRGAAGGQQMGGQNPMNMTKSRARKITADQPEVKFTDVAGVEAAKEELAEVVEFLKSPEKFSKVGARIPKGVLLIGPPGTGKTLMARAVAGEANVPFFRISGSEFVELFVGVGASRVRDLFGEAKKASPCIIFIDEIDAVGRQRGRGLGGGNDEREQTLNQILVEMDGFDKNAGIVVVAATNRPDILDSALTRPGRFDRQVALDSPDVKGRTEILKVHARGKPLAEGVELEKLARQTPGFSGADLENLMNEAAILVARRDGEEITLSDLEEAVDRVMVGPERKGNLITEEEKTLTAYHEMGHALAAYYMPHLDPVHKVTIVARGRTGGHTRLLPSGDRRLWMRSQMEEMLVYAMGGLAAEELIFGQWSSGPQGDLQQATEIAKKMVTTYGMSEKVGTVSLGSGGVVDYLGHDLAEGRNHSEATAALVDQEVRRLVDEARTRARQVLTEHREQLVRASELLKENETLTGEEIAAVLGERPRMALFEPRVNPEEPVEPGPVPSEDESGARAA
jgi:cell division protease FtsH